jgi:hypothetical protein
MSQVTCEVNIVSPGLEDRAIKVLRSPYENRRADQSLSYPPTVQPAHPTIPTPASRLHRRVALTVVALAAATGLGGCRSPSITQAPPPAATQLPPAATTPPPPSSEVDDREALDARSHCGTERWSIKTGTDPETSLINLTAPPALTTVGALTSLTPPNPIPPTHRVRPVETTAYTLSGVLIAFKLEGDSDYHLVIADGDRTMIVEIPLPSCVSPGPDPLRAGIATARQKFQARYQPGPSIQQVNVPVTVTGVGFFDFLHGQYGVAPNAIELHPVVNITFN